MSLPASETAQTLGEILAGRRRASADGLDPVAGAPRLSPEEQDRLHRAAAKDHGFKIDLTTKKDP